MVRGMYTAASGMIAQQGRLNVVSNNLANADTHGYKKDIGCMKSFPEMLAARTDDDGVVVIPIGSYDISPSIGRLGTGVELNEVYTQFQQGTLKETGNPFDVALQSEGFIAVETPKGERYTRNGSFLLDKEGFLVTKDGYKVLGENGPIQIKKHNVLIDEQGRIFVNSDLQGDPERLVDANENNWKGMTELDRLKVVRFENERYLKKQGNSLWKDTKVSGPAEIAEYGRNRPKVVTGFLEASNVNPVNEMVEMIEVQRAYEMNSKVITTQDALVGKAVNEVGRTY